MKRTAKEEIMMKALENAVTHEKPEVHHILSGLNSAILDVENIEWAEDNPDYEFCLHCGKQTPHIVIMEEPPIITHEQELQGSGRLQCSLCDRKGERV